MAISASIWKFYVHNILKYFSTRLAGSYMVSTQILGGLWMWKLKVILTFNFTATDQITVYAILHDERLEFALLQLRQ